MGRRPLDFYETPEHYVKQILPQVPADASVFEPCVGDGAISRFFPGRCRTNDLDPLHTADTHFDATESWPKDHYDWVITNPPFKDAMSILWYAWHHANAVAMLLRISFFEPTRDRVAYLHRHPPQGLIYLPRYSFTQNGKSDSTTCVWGIWGVTVDPPIQIAKRF
jgi:hypothetical protein